MPLSSNIQAYVLVQIIRSIDEMSSLNMLSRAVAVLTGFSLPDLDQGVDLVRVDVISKRGLITLNPRGIGR
jgi:hypothetical protein